MKELSKIVSPFSGRPQTRQAIDREGNLSFTVTARELTPVRAKIADFCAGVSAIALLVGGVLIANDYSDAQEPLWWVIVIGPFLGFPLYQLLWRYALRKTTRMELSADRFAVPSWLGWKRYDRKLPHKFTLVPHDWARIEAEDHEFTIRQAQMNGKLIRPTRYYGESWHLSFEYLGQRNDVLTIFGRKPALAVLTRLIAVDEVLDAHARMGDGVALTPGEQWGAQPGDIPDAP